MPANGWVGGGGTGWVCGDAVPAMVARFGAAEEAMLPPADGWLQHVDVNAACGVDAGGGEVGGVDPLTCQRLVLDSSLEVE